MRSPPAGSNIDAYVESLANPQPRTGRAAAEPTVARRLAALAGLYTYALAEEVLDLSPMLGVRRPRLGQAPDQPADPWGWSTPGPDLPGPGGRSTREGPCQVNDGGQPAAL